MLTFAILAIAAIALSGAARPADSSPVLQSQAPGLAPMFGPRPPGMLLNGHMENCWARNLGSSHWGLGCRCKQ